MLSLQRCWDCTASLSALVPGKSVKFRRDIYQPRDCLWHKNTVLDASDGSTAIRCPVAWPMGPRAGPIISNAAGAYRPCPRRLLIWLAARFTAPCPSAETELIAKAECGSSRSACQTQSGARQPACSHHLVTLPRITSFDGVAFKVVTLLTALEAVKRG